MSSGARKPRRQRCDAFEVRNELRIESGTRVCEVIYEMGIFYLSTSAVPRHPHLTSQFSRSMTDRSPWTVTQEVERERDL